MSYAKLIAAAEQLPEFDVEWLDRGDYDTIRRVLAECKPTLDSVRQIIVGRPQVPTEFSSEYFDRHVTCLQPLRRLTVGMKLEINLLFHSGETEQAVSCALDMIHLAHCQRRNGLIVDMLVACATWEVGVSVLAKWRRQLSPSLRQRLIRRLIESEAECEPITVILARDALWSSIVAFPPMNEQELRRSLEGEFGEDEVEWMIEFNRQAAEAPPASNQGHCFEASDRALGHQRLLVIELAIGNYIESSGVPPASLDDLVPKYLLTRLPDPFINADFKYHVEADTYALYSVGSKRTDMGGVRGSWYEAATGLADMFLDSD